MVLLAVFYLVKLSDALLEESFVRKMETLAVLLPMFIKLSTAKVMFLLMLLAQLWLRSVVLLDIHPVVSNTVKTTEILP